MSKNSVIVFKTFKENKTFNLEEKKIQNEEKLNKIFDTKKNLVNVSYKTIENAGDYICIFDSCEKKFKNFCRWKLHYVSHVIKFIYFLIFIF